MPYAVLLHGAEVAIPGRLPASRSLLAHVVRQAGAGHLGRRLPGRRGPTGGAGPGHAPGGRDPARGRPRPVRPAGRHERARARADLGLPGDGPLVVSVSRLVPRKGMDVLIDAVRRARRSGSPT